MTFHDIKQSSHLYSLSLSFSISVNNRAKPLNVATVPPPSTPSISDDYVAEISADNPLKVIISGAGVGGLALAKVLSKNPNMDVTIFERTDEFKRFGGPIQLASNALQVLKEMDQDVFEQIMEKFTFTGDKENGIKDGIRTEWYAKFDLKSPAENRNMPYTGVIERPDLQEIYLKNLPKGVVQNGDGVKSYTKDPKTGRVTVELESGKKVQGDVLIGADGTFCNSAYRPRCILANFLMLTITIQYC
jgi:zeaxanthin epoxidase